MQEAAILGVEVSIHAPVRGATESALLREVASDVSIHAPVRGATGAGTGDLGRGGFNPRPRAGGDRGLQVDVDLGQRFNPRPRAGGDRRGGGRHEFSSSFNPRPRAGGDVCPFCFSRCRAVSIHAPVRGATSWDDASSDAIRFQSTPPCGGRRRRDRLTSATGCSFNPRPRAGGDARPLGKQGPGTVSIHAPVRGATGSHVRGMTGHQVSIHAPVRGATGDGAPEVVVCWVSIHAPVRGATSTETPEAKPGKVSIHAPVRGATAFLHAQEPRFRFQSTPPCGGRPRAPDDLRRPERFNPRPRAGGDCCA